MQKQVLFSVCVPGRPIVKKNQQRVVGVGKAKRVIYSPQYIEWEKIALLHVYQARPLNLINMLLTADYKFFFENQKAEPDTSNLVEGIQDVLTKAGVILDDKLIMKFTAEKVFGEKPRTEVVLYGYA